MPASPFGGPPRAGRRVGMPAPGHVCSLSGARDRSAYGGGKRRPCVAQCDARSSAAWCGFAVPMIGKEIFIKGNLKGLEGHKRRRCRRTHQRGERQEHEVEPECLEHHPKHRRRVPSRKDNSQLSFKSKDFKDASQVSQVFRLGYSRSRDNKRTRCT